MSGTDRPPVAERRRQAAVAGHTGDATLARRLAADPDGSVRATALGALARLGALTVDELDRAATDADPTVRRRATELAGDPTVGDDERVIALVGRTLDDPDDRVAEVAAWALGERAGADPVTGDPSPALPDLVLRRLIDVATDHVDALCREAAVAALGAVGRPEGLPALLRATTDKPAVRRRAVIALAAFLDHPEALAAARAATSDRDWQVREAAEILLDGVAIPPGPARPDGVTP